MSHAGATALIRLPSAITIKNVTELHGQLRTRLRNGGPLLLDGSAVQSLDGAGIQLLVALVSTARRSGTELSWHGVSEVLHDAGQQLGVAVVMRLPPQPEKALAGDTDLV